MTELFHIAHEDGSLDEYDSIVTDSGDLSAAAEAALGATQYGLKCEIDDNANIYGVKNLTPPVSGVIRVRFYFDTNSLAMGSGDVFALLDITGDRVFIVSLQYSAGGDYEVVPRVIDDNAAWLHIEVYQHAVTDGEHYVEFRVTKASGAAANNGEAQWWIDGELIGSISNIDLYNNWNWSYCLFGPIGVDNNTRGIFYLDEFVVTDDDNQIGPRSLPGTEILLLERGDRSQREALNSPLKQGSSETIKYYVNFTPWGASSSYPVGTPVIKVLDQDDTDVTSTVCANGGYISEDTKIWFILTGLTVGDRFRVYVKGTINSLVGECWTFIDGEL